MGYNRHGEGGEVMYFLKGHRYMGTVTLGFFQRIASNAAIGEKFLDAGFEAVIVSGDGKTRTATGTWAKEDQDAELPPEVSDVHII